MRIRDKVKKPQRPVVAYEILPPREKDGTLNSYAETISSLLSQTHIDAINIPEVLDENGNPIESNLLNVTANANQEKTTYTDENFSKNQADKDVWEELKQMEAEEYNRINENKDTPTDNPEDNKDKTIDENLVNADAEKNDNASYGADVKAIASESGLVSLPTSSKSKSISTKPNSLAVLAISKFLPVNDFLSP